MKLETFFNKFDQFADAPDAIEKMRELVLDLAVHGKIADQDSSDEPAADLLQRLIVFKLANPLSGRGGRSKEGPVEIEANCEGPPPNWVNTTIGEVLYVIRGSSPRPKGDPQYFSDTRTPYHWVKISDIRKHGKNGLLMDTDEFLTEAGMGKSVLLPKGTLVLTNSATIGVPIVLGIDGCCIHDGYLAFPNFPHELLCQKFLLYLFHTLKKHAERNARGLAQLNLNTDLVRSFPFGLPPLAEQKRIVAKVDELMALCDRLEAQQKEREAKHAVLARAALARFADAPTPANLGYLFHNAYTIDPAALRRAILTMAAHGKLVPQDSRDPVSRGPTSVTDAPFDIPPTWSWVTLGDLVESMSNGIYKPAKFDSKTGTVCVRMYNIQDGRLDLTKLRRLDLSKSEIEQYCLGSGDLLINRVNSRELVGKCAVVTEVVEPMVYEAMNIRVRLFKERELPLYINLVLLSDRVRNFFMDCAKQAIGQASVNQQQVASVPIPLPPLAEQRRIVAKVDALMALVDRLEAQLAESRALAGRLMEAVVHELTTDSAPPSESSSAPITANPPTIDQNTARAVLSAEIVHQLRCEERFGQVKHQKILHLVEHIFQLPEIGGTYRRNAAGPHDRELLAANEAEMERQEWYREVQQSSSRKHDYLPLAKAGGHAALFKQQWPDKAAAIREFIDLVRPWDTDKCELVSTAYAAWNDLLIWGKPATEEAVLHEIRDRWHESKLRFTKQRWSAIIKWMKDNGYVPTGFGQATCDPE